MASLMQLSYETMLDKIIMYMYMYICHMCIYPRIRLKFRGTAKVEVEVYLGLSLVDYMYISYLYVNVHHYCEVWVGKLIDLPSLWSKPRYLSWIPSCRHRPSCVFLDYADFWMDQSILFSNHLRKYNNGSIINNSLSYVQKIRCG